MSLCLGLIAGFHFVAISSPAYAQGPAPVAGEPPPPPVVTGAPVTGGGDVIVLKSGGMLQGTLIDAIPGSHARIQLRTGEIATVRWSEIDHIERTPGSAAPPSTAPLPAVAPATPAPLMPSGATANVHIDSENTVELQWLRPSGEWVTACVSPCDKPVSLEGDYRITGNGVKTTPVFRIAAEANQNIVLHVTPRDGGLFGLGITGIALGGLGLFVGLIVVLVGAAVNTGNDISSSGTSTSSSSSSGDGTETTGWVITGVSALVLVGGILLTTGNTRTKVDQQTYNGAVQGPPPEARMPMWREVGSTTPRAPTTVPIFSASF